MANGLEPVCPIEMGGSWQANHLHNWNWRKLHKLLQQLRLDGKSGLLFFGFPLKAIALSV
jgi:hypothetical protein